MRGILSAGALAFGLDAASKFLIRLLLEEGKKVCVLGDFLRLTYSKNPGAIFGFFPQYSTFLLLLSCGVIISFALLTWRRVGRMSKMERIGFGFIFGGALSNLVDRIFFGGVIDFLDIGFGEYRWPAFNLADFAICIGILAIGWKCIRK